MRNNESNSLSVSVSAFEQSPKNRIVRNLGFGCALVALVVMFTLCMDCPINLGFAVVPASLGILLLCIPLLTLAARFNDFLTTKTGQKCLMVLAIASGLALLLMLLAGHSLVGIVSAAIFASASILLWGSSLVYSKRSELYLTTALSFASAGLVLLLGFSVHASASFLGAVTVSLLFTLWLCFSKENLTYQGKAVTVDQSRLRGAAGRGNRFTLVSIGMSVGAAMTLGYLLAEDSLLFALLIGSTVLLASLVTVVLRARFKQTYEDLTRRTLAVFTTLAILPFSFVPPSLQVVSLCMLVASTTSNCIILIDAIAQTARLKRISPYWLIGNEGTFFIAGVSFALGAFWIFFLAGTAVSAVTCCVVFACAFAALQIFIEAQSYPYFDSVASEEEDSIECTTSLGQQEGDRYGGGAKWRERVDQVAAEHRLSPRQQEVMRLLLKGRDVRYIMSTFVISQATAKTHIYNLYKKLGVHSRRELLDLIEHPQVSKEEANRDSFEAG